MTSVLNWYRGECYRSDYNKTGPTREKWTDGATAALEIAPATGKIINVTELILESNSVFAFGSGDTLDISPWGLSVSETESFEDLNDLYSLFERIGGRVVASGSDPQHLIRVAFRPFIRLEYGETFTIENSGGATQSLNDANDYLYITVMAFEIDAADE